MNILLMILPTKFFIYPFKKYIDIMGTDDEEWYMSRFRKFHPNLMTKIPMFKRTCNEVYASIDDNHNIDFFDLDARLVKKYKRIDLFNPDLREVYNNFDMTELLNEIELQHDRYDILMFSMIEEPAFGAEYIFELQKKFGLTVIKHLKEKFSDVKVVAGGEKFENIESSLIDYVHQKQITKEQMKKIIDGDYDIEVIHHPNFPPANPNVPVNVDDYRYSYDTLLDFYNINESIGNGHIMMAEVTLFQGCPGTCAFCMNAPSKVRFTDFTDMMMRYIDSGFNTFFFLNNCINPIAHKLCNWIAQKNLKIQFLDSSRHSLDPDYYKMLYESGCRILHFGVETNDDDVLKYINKGFTHDEMKESIKLSHDAGIWNIGSVIVNLPYSKKDNREKIFEFLLGYQRYIQSISILQFCFYPATPFSITPEKFDVKYIDRNPRGFIWKETKGHRGYIDSLREAKENILNEDIINSRIINWVQYHLLFALYDYYNDKTEVLKFVERNVYESI